ncbi:hypothetical protein Glove_117g303 [Diversispora epigaea]|uniref:Uncharacterized protein n=1 Tax=Diversispora epigaea TaxID=1348612 RepID=A0A397JA36_9GLOM|nr:hypothetical protein Glove_117g303 [Diversispora epigaea]
MTMQLTNTTKITSRMTNNEDCNNRTFNQKILFDELPVLRNLNIRKPEIYKQKTCVMCNKDIEDTLHPFICNNFNTFLREKYIEHIALIGKNYGSQKSKTNIIKAYRHENFLKIDMGRQLRGTINSDQFNFIDIMRGLSYKHMSQKIKSHVISDIQIIKDIQFKIYNYLRKLMKQRWTERCSTFLEWEKRQNISKENKGGEKDKNDRKHKKRPTKTRDEKYETIKKSLIIQQWGCDLLILEGLYLSKKLMKQRWTERCSTFLEWEKRQNISKENKGGEKDKNDRKHKKRPTKTRDEEYETIKKSLIIQQWGCDLLILEGLYLSKWMVRRLNK